MGKGRASKSELEVLRIVQDFREATVGQVREALDERIDAKQVKVYLHRLRDKGYLKSRLQGRSRVYRPSLDVSAVIRAELKDLVNRLYAGKFIPLFQHLIQVRPLNDAERRHIRELVSQMEEDPEEP